MYTVEQKKQIHKHSLRVVILSQTFGGLGLAAGITVGALIAQDLLKSDTLAGLPLALFTLGSALAVLLVGRITQKNGRRLGLSAGFIIGGLGALGVIFSTANTNIFFLFYLWIWNSNKFTGSLCWLRFSRTGGTLSVRSV